MKVAPDHLGIDGFPCLVFWRHADFKVDLGKLLSKLPDEILPEIEAQHDLERFVSQLFDSLKKVLTLCSRGLARVIASPKRAGDCTIRYE